MSQIDAYNVFLLNFVCCDFAAAVLQINPDAADRRAPASIAGETWQDKLHKTPELLNHLFLALPFVYPGAVNQNISVVIP